MRDFRIRLLSTASIVPIAIGVAASGAAFSASQTSSQHTIVAQSNPCAAKAPCNPCAAKKPCNPCNPCAAKAPCNPCAAKAACNPCAARKPCSPCNPCAAKATSNPCNPCAAGAATNASTRCFVPRVKAAAACNPCAAKKPCAPCTPAKACNPCAAKKPSNPCNPCAANNPCNPCNPCAAAASVEVTPEESAVLYDCLKTEMTAGYRKSNDRFVRAYDKWNTFNTTPYVSDTHGARLVNNYANPTAQKAYGLFDKLRKMPTGSILAKDSFTVTSTGAGAPGPVFLMEKMVKGWNAETANWKYTMVMPNGDVFGRTNGTNAQGMAFCHECHVAAEDNDFVMFMPEEFRKKQ
jgi:hypothetical protein